MGILGKIRRRLPIVGSGGNVKASGPAPSRPAPPPYVDPEPEPQSPRGDQDVATFLKDLVTSNLVVLFMKGSPANPMCGFSANAAGILSSYGKTLTHFDVLSDPDVREGVKQFSDWPTIPQIYVGGEFLGGSDILRQMHESGELKDLIEQTSASGEESPAGEEPAP